MRIELVEVGTGKKFLVLTKAKTLHGLKAACLWVGTGKYKIEYCTHSNPTVKKLDEWLQAGGLRYHKP